MLPVYEGARGIDPVYAAPARAGGAGAPPPSPPSHEPGLADLGPRAKEDDRATSTGRRTRRGRRGDRGCVDRRPSSRTCASRYLGRKSELAQALRGVRDRESGMLLNGIRDAARGGGRRARARARRRGARPAPARGGDRRHAARRGAAARAACTRSRRSGAPSRTRSSASATRCATTARSRRSNTTSTSSRSCRRTRRARRATRSSSTTTHVLRTETSPSQIHILEEKPPPIYMVSIGRVYRRDAITATRYPIFHQFEGLAVDQGPDARRPEGDAAARDARALRARAARALPDALLPVHRAVDRAGRLVRDLRRRGLPHLQALRLDRDGRRRHGRSARCSRTSASTPRSGAASRSAAGSSAPRSCATTSPTSARSGRATCAC